MPEREQLFKEDNEFPQGHASCIIIYSFYDSLWSLFHLQPSLNLISLEGSDVFQERDRVAAFWTRSLGGYNWRPGHERDSLGHHP